ncbi:MAG: macro domain-containing protein [Ruminococcaceae bacterium]|nr:macro domain-containing protein [Oscillospiraceae bacterium]
MPFRIEKNDITKMKVDAIVNAANTELVMGGGVSGAIYKAAGIKELRKACEQLAPIKTGEAVITPGFNLPAKYIIHTAGPVYRSSEKEKCRHLLKNSYKNSLKLALENNCESIAFPLISSGIYGYPKDEALATATNAITGFLEKHDMDVVLVIFDGKSFEISRELQKKIDRYLNEHYASDEKAKSRFLESVRGARRKSDVQFLELAMGSPEEAKASAPKESIDDIVDNIDESFSSMLFRIIDSKELTDTQVYKRANIDRKLFSKIRSIEGYTPGKRTAIALAVALELDLDETDAFLKHAGYALSHAVKFDVIIEYFIVNGRYDIFEINEVLFKYDQPLLGA